MGTGSSPNTWPAGVKAKGSSWSSASSLKTSIAAYLAAGALSSHSVMMEADPTLFARRLEIRYRYQETIARALSEEAGLDSDTDVYAKLFGGACAGHRRPRGRPPWRPGADPRRRDDPLNEAIRLFPARADAKAPSHAPARTRRLRNARSP